VPYISLIYYQSASYIVVETFSIIIVSNKLDSYLFSLLFILILNLDEGCDVISYMTVIQVTKHDRNIIFIIGWSHISQSQIIQSHITEKDIEGSRTDNVIQYINSMLAL